MTRAYTTPNSFDLSLHEVRFTVAQALAIAQAARLRPAEHRFVEYITDRPMIDSWKARIITLAEEIQDGKY